MSEEMPSPPGEATEDEMSEEMPSPPGEAETSEPKQWIRSRR